VSGSVGANERVRLDAVVRGRVQGVGFRYFVLDRALAADLAGWVANEPDGSGRCRAEGSRSALDGLLAALEEGPLGGRVTGVDARWGPAAGDLGRFAIRSGAHSGD
jgi:acylphosphatase